jgi:hypothetical protein
VFDYVQNTLGDIQNVQSQVQIQFPELKVQDPAKGGAIVETVKSDVPDLINVIGSLPSSANIDQGASLHISLRRGQTFKGEPGLVWTINGDKGEIRLVVPSGPGLQAFATSADIDIHDFETDEVQKVEWDYGRWSDLPVPARNIGALYEAYAEGDTTKYPNFDHALKRHTQLDEILSGFDAGRSV